MEVRRKEPEPEEDDCDGMGGLFDDGGSSYKEKEKESVKKGKKKEMKKKLEPEPEEDDEGGMGGLFDDGGSYSKGGKVTIEKESIKESKKNSEMSNIVCGAVKGKIEVIKSKQKKKEY